MSATGKFPVRFVLYGSIATYLLGDLLLFHGPLRQKIDLANPKSPAAMAAAKAQGLVARVSSLTITRGQLDRAVNERLWLEGKSPASISPAELQTTQNAALEDLVVETLLDLQAKALATQLAVRPEEINDRFARLSGRFEDKAAFDTAMKSQGIASEQALRDRIAARLLREKYIELRILPNIRVSEEEARKWFEENKASLALPERIEARHIFLPTLDHPPEEAKQKLDAALAELLEKKKDFPTLARELSEDPATKDSGGNLGWMTRDRLPADFSAPVFSLEPNKPALVRTKLGWHLVEVTAHKPAERRGFEQAKAEILAALESVKRRQATDDLRKSMRRTESANIEIYQNSSTASN